VDDSREQSIRILEERVVAYFNVVSGIWLEGLEKITTNISRNSRCLGRTQVRILECQSGCSVHTVSTELRNNAPHWNSWTGTATCSHSANINYKIKQCN